MEVNPSVPARTVPEFIAYAKANPGKLRPLAVTSKERLAALPDLPPVADFLPGYEAAGWLGLGAPKGTSRDIIDTLNKETNAALADDSVKKHLADIGVLVRGGTPEEFGKYIASETAKWGKVIRDAGIKPD